MLKIFNRTFSDLTHNISRWITGPVTRLDPILESMLITGLMCLPLILYIWLTFFDGGFGGSGTAGLATLPIGEVIAEAQTMADRHIQEIAQAIADAQPFTMDETRAALHVLLQFLREDVPAAVNTILVRLIRRLQNLPWHLNVNQHLHILFQPLAAQFVLGAGVVAEVDGPIQPRHIEGRHLLDQNPEIEADIQHNRATCIVICGFVLYFVMNALAAQAQPA